MSSKIRTVPADDATSIAVAAAEALVPGGQSDLLQVLLHVRFDRRRQHRTGHRRPPPRLQTDFTIACPSYPALARTVYAGHLFVGDKLLSDSSMRHHPLTPMTDANLVRVLGRQTTSRVGLVELGTVEEGAPPIASRFASLPVPVTAWRSSTLCLRRTSTPSLTRAADCGWSRWGGARRGPRPRESRSGGGSVRDRPRRFRRRWRC